MDLHEFWRATLAQDAARMREFFHPDAYVNWHNSNEHFTVEEFIRANCEYPGAWDGAIKRIEQAGDLFITATHVYSRDGALSFHVVSYYNKFWLEAQHPAGLLSFSCLSYNEGEQPADHYLLGLLCP